MYQLMILDAKGNIVGACTDSSRLPDVKEVFPGKNYTGIETPYNLDLVYNYRNYCFRNGRFVKKMPVPYQITKQHIKPEDYTTLFVPKDTVAVIGGIEYAVDDGVIEYSNPNAGVHQILLMLDGCNNTPVYVEVIGE